MDSPWLRTFKRIPTATARLFCFHCAGGSASEFRNWPTHLSSKIELVAVQLPGREGRINEAFITKMDDLIGSVVHALTPYLDKPFAIFGHSLGAIAGFEVIRKLRRNGLNEPILYIAAGWQAPHIKDKNPPISELPQEEFIEELQRDYGDHIGPILESAELREMFVPQIRADFALNETYRFRVERPLDCPISAFAGVSEQDLEADELNAWSLHTNGDFRSQRFPGDHFFIRESQELVIEAITREIFSILPALT